MLGALIKRYGRSSAKLVAGRRVRCTADDGEVFVGVIEEIGEVDGRRVLRVRLDTSDGQAAQVVEVPATAATPAGKT